MKRRNLLAMAPAGAVAGLVSNTARAEDTVTWRMVTSWPKNLPGPGVSAHRLAERITTMSGGRLTVELYAAGELVPALEVLDAVGNGVAHMGHTASFFWAGKMPAAAFFTAAPFGLMPLEHHAWIEQGGGQQLWDTLYEPFGVKPFMAGNSGMQMGGWLREEINSVEDFKGLKFRMPGLGGEVLRELGATTVLLAPGEIYQALDTGVIDGTEFLGPWSDHAAGFYRAAPFYYSPGFHEPNGTGEALVNLEAWNALDPSLQEIVSSACAVEAVLSVSEANWNNAQSLTTLVEDHGVQLRSWPEDVLEAARQATTKVMQKFRDGSEIEQQIIDSYEAALGAARGWSALSAEAFLNSRNVS